MTREEAEKCIKSKMCKDCGVYLGGGKCLDTCKIIEAIKTLEQELCDDTVSRKAVYEQINSWNRNGEYSYTNATYYLMKRIRDIPPVTPQQKRGKWERHNTYHGDDTSGFVDPDWRCSECGGQANVNEWLIYDLTDFCPNCGAKMEIEE